MGTQNARCATRLCARNAQMKAVLSEDMPPLLQTLHYSPHQLAYFAYKLSLHGATDPIDGMAGVLLDA